LEDGAVAAFAVGTQARREFTRCPIGHCIAAPWTARRADELATLRWPGAALGTTSTIARRALTKGLLVEWLLGAKRLFVTEGFLVTKRLLVAEGLFLAKRLLAAGRTRRGLAETADRLIVPIGALDDAGIELGHKFLGGAALVLI